MSYQDVLLSMTSADLRASAEYLKVLVEDKREEQERRERLEQVRLERECLERTEYELRRRALMAEEVTSAKQRDADARVTKEKQAQATSTPQRPLFLPDTPLVNDDARVVSEAPNHSKGKRKLAETIEDRAPTVAAFPCDGCGMNHTCQLGWNKKSGKANSSCVRCTGRRVKCTFSKSVPAGPGTMSMTGLSTTAEVRPSKRVKFSVKKPRFLDPELEDNEEDGDEMDWPYETWREPGDTTARAIRDLHRGIIDFGNMQFKLTKDICSRSEEIASTVVDLLAVANRIAVTLEGIASSKSQSPIGSHRDKAVDARENGSPEVVILKGQESTRNHGNRETRDKET